MLGAMHNKWLSRYKRATLRAEHLHVAGSRGMVTSLMDTAHKTDTECHEAAITAIYTDKLYHRQDDTMAFRFQLSFSFKRETDSVISTGKETEGPL